jgi:arylsulfatase A-like enzyme
LQPVPRLFSDRALSWQYRGAREPHLVPRHSPGHRDHAAALSGKRLYHAEDWKIFHGGYDDHTAWVEGGDPTRREPEKPITEAEREARRAANIAKAENFPWRAVDEAEVPELPDVKVTNAAASYLEKYKGKTFFLAVGYHKPHTPFVCPKRYVDRYDPKNIPLPPYHALRPTAGSGVPKAAVRDVNADLFVTAEATPEKTREALAAYYGCVSFIDGEVGRLLGTLDRLGLRDNTIVALLSDHGYHLGDRGRWSKHNSLFEQVARVPFIIDAPGTKGRGLPSPRPVELVDLFPTLTALAGLPTPAGIQGDSLVLLLENPQAAWDRAAYTETLIHPFHKARTLGRSIRTERWRYTEWDEGRAGVELYDHANDPQEGKNLAGDPESAAKHAAEIQALQKMLRAGDWMATVPVPGMPAK